MGELNMLVSILIPCFNAERWVGQAIQSALDQTWPHKEIVVVDDGSTDGSLKVIKSFGDRIRLEATPNRGGNAARNRLLEMAKGDWLQYLDADDYLLPKKIEKQLECLRHSPETDVVFSRVVQETHTATGTTTGISRLPEPSDDHWILLVRWDLGQTGAMLWRKRSIEDVGGWKLDQPCCQEHELYLRLLQGRKRFSYCSDTGAVYRQWRGGSVCTRNPGETNRRRLSIIRAAESFLEERGELSTPRRCAINHARLEVARLAWGYDRQFASDIAQSIRASQPAFRPDTPGARITYGAGYRWAYRLLGFDSAEQIAALLRLPRRSS